MPGARSKRNAPQPVLLEQLVATRIQLVELGVVAEMERTHAPAADLLACIDEVIARGRAAAKGRVLADLQVGVVGERRARWLTEVTEWSEDLRARIAALRAPDQELAVEELNRPLATRLGRRFAATADALTLILAVIARYADVLDPASWRPDLVTRGGALTAAAAKLRSDDEIALRVRRDFAAEVAASRAEIQRVLRETGVTWELTRSGCRSLPPMSLDVLDAWVAGLPPARSYSGSDGESAPGQGELATGHGELATGPGELATGQGELATDQGEFAPDQGEFAPDQGECATVQPPGQAQIRPGHPQIRPDRPQIRPGRG